MCSFEASENAHKTIRDDGVAVQCQSGTVVMSCSDSGKSTAFSEIPAHSKSCAPAPSRSVLLGEWCRSDLHLEGVFRDSDRSLISDRVRTVACCPCPAHDNVSRSVGDCAFLVPAHRREIRGLARVDEHGMRVPEVNILLVCHDPTL